MRERIITFRACPHCKTEKAYRIGIGDIWVNDAGYQVRILDFGDNEVWLFYLENDNRTAWEMTKFLDAYRPLK